MGTISKATNSSWRMDETAVSVRGRWLYLYRAVDRNGKSIHSLLCEDRTVDSAQEFFRQAVKVTGSRWPEKVNLDGNAASHRALRLLREEDARWQSVKIRACRYLNNIVEQDHRAIKRRCAPMLGLKSFRTAAVTFSGIELAHRIRKRQFNVPYQRNGRALTLKELWDRALSGGSLSPTVENTDRPLMHQISPIPPRVRPQRTRSTAERSCSRWVVIQRCQWRVPGHGIAQHGSCLPAVSTLRTRERRCVKSPAVLGPPLSGRQRARSCGLC